MSLEDLSLPSASRDVGSLVKSRLLIIDPLALRRRSLQLMFRLHAPEFFVEGIEKTEEAHDLHADVVLCAISGRQGDLAMTVANLQKIRHFCGKTPMAAYTDVESVALARELLRTDISGVICMSMEIEVAIAAVRFIYAGGTFLTRDPLVAEDPKFYYGPNSEELTHREEQIYELICLGRPNKIIAHSLGISVNTVKVHLYRLMRKLGATNRTEVALHTYPLHVPPIAQ